MYHLGSAQNHLPLAILALLLLLLVVVVVVVVNRTGVIHVPYICTSYVHI